MNGDSSLPAQLVAQQQLQQQPPHQVTEDDRFSMGGLFAAMRSDAGEGSSLAKGQDLMLLGLDIHSQE